MSIYSISIRELRPRLPEVVADVAENMTRYIITKRGKPACVVINKHEYDTLLESLELQSDQTLIKEIEASEAEFNKKKGRRLEDIRRGL